MSVSGAVKVWDPRQKNDPVAVMEPAEGDNRRDCWAVAFGKYSSSLCKCVCLYLPLSFCLYQLMILYCCAQLQTETLWVDSPGGSWYLILIQLA